MIKLKFIAGIGGHLMLVIADDLTSAKEEIKKVFGNVEVVELNKTNFNFILEVDVLNEEDFKFLKVDGGH